MRRKISSWDFWVGEDAARAYRDRRARRTRAPLEWEHARGYMAFVAIPIALMVAGVRLLADDGDVAKAFAVLSIAGAVASAAAILRYVSRPVDEEFKRPRR